MLKTFYAVTLGCKVNTYETNIICNDLKSIGIIQIDDYKLCDIAIINTCSVTNTADSKSRNMISRIRNTNSNAIIIVCGCYSQVASDKLKNKYGIDILIGNKYKNNIIELLNEYLKNKQQIVKIDNLLLEKEFENTAVDTYSNQTRAFVKIQDGCNFMCSYCIIPFTRGRQRSKPMELIISEIKKLVQNDYKEIVLTGVNTAGYENNGNNFYNLLQEINRLDGNFRVRISSVEPFQINDEIVELICNNAHRFAQHWHICLQSGSNEILKKMNRKYTIEQFSELINKIYKFNKLSGISTDVICGFPTETNENHFSSMEFIRKMEFMKLHVFPYSKRNYTNASQLKQVDDNEKKNRVKQMLELNNLLARSFANKFIGKIVEVLFETYENNINSGYSSEYLRVELHSNINYVNKIVKVKIVKIFMDHVISEI